jgi:hypothetical protein
LLHCSLLHRLIVIIFINGDDDNDPIFDSSKIFPSIDISSYGEQSRIALVNVIVGISRLDIDDEDDNERLFITAK